MSFFNMSFLYWLEGLRTPFFDKVFSAVTLLGEETLFMVVAMLVFWCIDKRKGYFLLYISFLGALVNGFIKLLFCIPRPWVADSKFTIVESARKAATSYSFPSGHTQSAGGLFLGLARQSKRLWFILVCSVLVLLVGLSRMYLGVHYLADVLVSLGTSLLMVLLFAPLFQKAWDDKRWFILILGVLIAIGASLILYAEFGKLPEHAIAEFTAECVKSAYTMFGASLGLVLVLWLEQRYIRFSTKAVWWAQLLKVAIGLGLVIAARMLLKNPLLKLFNSHYTADMLRYLVMVLLGGAVWPMSFRLFEKLGKPKAANAA